MLRRAVGAGLLAGTVGTLAMTLGEKVEQRLTGRPDSQVPGRTLARMLGTEGSPGSTALVVQNWAMHLGTGALVGVHRGLMAYAGMRGVRPSAMFTVVRLSVDQTVENLTGAGAPPATWPRLEQVVDVLHKAVYAFVTGAVADRLAERGLRPGERHASLRPGRHSDVGPVPREQAYAH